MMSNNKKEVIVLSAIVLIVVVVGWYALVQRKMNNEKVKTEMIERTVVDSLQTVIGDINQQFNDSLSVLDDQIEMLHEKISNAEISKISQNDLKRLDDLIKKSSQLTNFNSDRLLKLKQESLQSEYTPKLFADLIEALLVNIQQKQIRINDLESELSQIRDQLHFTEKENITLIEKTGALEKQVIQFEQEIDNIKASNEALLTVKYILGARRDLIKADVLKKIFMRRECLRSNEIPDSMFTEFVINGEEMNYILSGQVEADSKVLFAPMLRGADYTIENNSIKITINNPLEFVKMGPFIVYY